MNYTKEQCPVCGKEFEDGDDIVVCPDCGTPHHRQCYKDNRGCANDGKHGDGFVWKNSVPQPQPQSQPEPPKKEAFPFGGGFFQDPQRPTEDEGHKVIFCPNCGKENPAEEPTCTNCGARLYNTQNGGRPFVPPIQLPNMANQQFVNGAVQISPLDTIGENTVCDTAEFIGVNANKYIPKMYKMEKEKKKLSWNWAAFFFGPYWFFYRKIISVGVILMAITLVFSGFCTTERAIQKYSALNQVEQNVFTGEATREEAQNALLDYVKLPETLINFAATVLIHCYCGIMGNYHYKKKTEKDIKNIKQVSQNPEQYRINLFRRGGVSATMVMLAILLNWCMSFGISMILTQFLS